MAIPILHRLAKFPMSRLYPPEPKFPVEARQISKPIAVLQNVFPWPSQKPIERKGEGTSPSFGSNGANWSAVGQVAEVGEEKIRLFCAMQPRTVEPKLFSGQ